MIVGVTDRLPRFYKCWIVTPRKPTLSLSRCMKKWRWLYLVQFEMGFGQEGGMGACYALNDAKASQNVENSCKLVIMPWQQRYRDLLRSSETEKALPLLCQINQSRLSLLPLSGTCDFFQTKDRINFFRVVVNVAWPDSGGYANFLRLKERIYNCVGWALSFGFFNWQSPRKWMPEAMARQSKKRWSPQSKYQCIDLFDFCREVANPWMILSYSKELFGTI